MYLILMNRVILGADGYMNARHASLGSQIRIFCFGLNIAVFWGDKDPDGNGYEFHLGLYKINEVL